MRSLQLMKNHRTIYNIVGRWYGPTFGIFSLGTLYLHLLSVCQTVVIVRNMAVTIYVHLFGVRVYLICEMTVWIQTSCSDKLLWAPFSGIDRMVAIVQLLKPFTGAGWSSKWNF